MPFVCLELPQGLARDAVESLRKHVKAAIREHLATRDPRYDYAVIHEGALEQGFAGVTVDLRPGRTEGQKQGFVDAICRALSDMTGITSENVYVVFREVLAANHYCGGKPIREYVQPERSAISN